MAPSLDCSTTDVECIGRKDICSRLTSLAARLKAECLAKKREHMILKTVRYLACVSARIHFEAICDSILIKSFVELCGIGSQTVLVTYIDGDSHDTAGDFRCTDQRKRVERLQSILQKRRAVAFQLSWAGRDKAEDSSGWVTKRRPRPTWRAQKTAAPQSLQVF